MIALFLAFVALLLARRPARADPAADLLVQVRSQVSAAKAEAEKAKAKAADDLTLAQAVRDQTRTACQELVGAVEDLAKAQQEAYTARNILHNAENDARDLKSAAIVRKQAIRRVSLSRDEGDLVPLPDPTLVDELPEVTRGRVVKVCQAILAKPGPLVPAAAASAPATAPSTGWRRPF